LGGGDGELDFAGKVIALGVGGELALGDVVAILV
jgi:hypothetical protein